MSQQVMEKMIKEYLKNVKEKLPDWLKEKKQEIRDVLAELEEHIWDKAEELSDTGAPTEDSVRVAIAHMGTPENIAKEYKRRGTPKVYITEEMWPSYIKALQIGAIVIIAINVVSFVLNVIFGNYDFSSQIVGIGIGLMFVFSIITIIFVALSMEGYFPEDFKTEKELRKEKMGVEKAREKGIPISPKTGKPLKSFVDPAGEIVGGVIQCIIAIFLIAQPIPALFEIMHADFRTILVIFGIITFVEGALDLSRGIIGRYQPTSHQVIHGITIPLKIAFVPLAVILWFRPEIFPWFYIEEWGVSPLVNTGISPEFYDLYRIIVGLVIFGGSLAPLENVYKIVQIQRYKIAKAQSSSVNIYERNQ